jgi:hypothetical protein
MTIKRKLGLSLIASSLIAVAAMAEATPGIINGVGTVETPSISWERIAAGELNVSVTAFTFTPIFVDPAVRNNPIFEFTFSSEVAGNLEGYHIYEINATNEYNSSNPVSDDASINGNKISFAAADGSIVKANVKYGILKDGADGNASDVDNFGQVLTTIPQGGQDQAGMISINADVYTGDTGDHLSYAEKSPLYTVVKEYAIAVDKVFSRKTNLCSGRVIFDTSTGGCSAEDNATDTVSFKITRTNCTYNFNADGDASSLVIKGDNNLTSVQVREARDANVGFATTLLDTFGLTDDTILAITNSTGTSFEQNNLLTAANLAAATSEKVIAVQYEVNGSVTPIQDTKFGWEFKLSGPDGNTSAAGSTSFGTVASKAAGEWKTYGYAAQIPNVTTSVAAGIDTTIIMTNTNAANSDVYFTLIANGEECTVSSVDDGLSPMIGNSTTKYTADSLFVGDCAGMTATSFGVEIESTATPNDIYTAASFANRSGSVAIFKDLPVYSTSTLTY